MNIATLYITKHHYQEGMLKFLSPNISPITLHGYHEIGRNFHLDKVFVENRKIIKLDKRNISFIPGTIRTKYKLGFNKRGNPIYQFRPFSWEYPDFMVASSYKGFKDRYAVIKYLRWDKKLPQGEIVKMYDSYDNDLLLYQYNLPLKSPKFIPPISPDIFNPVEFFSSNSLRYHNDYRKLDVFSIDPKGSEDIDDAFSIEDNKNGIKMGIHIADVYFFIKEFNLGEIIKERYSSIYLPNKVINMIPEVLSNNMCSLKEGKDRLAFTLWLEIVDDKIVEYKIEKTIIQNRKQYSYEEADKKLINKEIYKLSKMIGIKYLNYEERQINKWNTHKMVEVYMILANHLICKLLKNEKNMVYRIHDKKENNTNIDYDNIHDEELEEIIKILKNQSAEYSLNNGIHYGLNLDYYTHFTSPIRRYIDIYVHQLLLNYITKNNEKNLEINLDNINDFMRRVKKLGKTINKMRLLDTEFENKKIGVYVIDYNDRHLTIYFPEMKIIYKYRLFNKLLDNKINVIKNGDEVIYFDIENKKEYKFKLFQKIEIKVHKKYEGREIMIEYLKDDNEYDIYNKFMENLNFNVNKNIYSSKNMPIPQLPDILYDVRAFLVTCDIDTHNSNRDGRINSCFDEDRVTALLKEKYQDHVIIPEKRMWYDILIFDIERGWLPVNIKSTTMVTADNVGNLSVCVQAYTNYKLDYEDMYTNGQMANILVEKFRNSGYNRDPYKDYYFIVINKNNTKDIIVNSILGLSKVKPNINNLPYQVKWMENREYNFTGISDKLNMFLGCIQQSEPSWKENFLQNMRTL